MSDAGGNPKGAGAAALAALALALLARPAGALDVPPVETRLDVHAFAVEHGQSGPVSYYQVEEDPAEAFLRARYRPPLESVTLSVHVPEALRRAVKKVRWRWRAMALPIGGDECRAERGDSSAAVYLVFHGTLRWYALKYVWSTVGRKGSTCAKRRTPFTAQDSIIRESGAPIGEWVTEEVDPAAEFRAHFSNRDTDSPVPDLVALAIMTDGDQTQSASSADYTGFTLVH